jgi:hypothetical protein
MDHSARVLGAADNLLSSSDLAVDGKRINDIWWNPEDVEPPTVASYSTEKSIFLSTSENKSSKAYLEKVAKRSRPDYERTMLLVADLTTKKVVGLAAGWFGPSRRAALTKYTTS